MRRSQKRTCPTLTPQIMADGPPYGIEYMRTELLHIYSVNCSTLSATTYAMDGIRPMTEKPTPNTSSGVKLRLNSVPMGYKCRMYGVQSVNLRPALFVP
jgi:hypothetical protein